MNILLAPAIYLALALLVAVLLGRRLRAAASPYIGDESADLDAPYTLHVEPLTPAEREALWHRIEARIADER